MMRTMFHNRAAILQLMVRICSLMTTLSVHSNAVFSCQICVAKTKRYIFLRLLTQCIIFLPSCIVFSVSTVLRGPSPTEVNANTSKSYSVYSSSPVTTFVRVDPLLIVIWVDDPEEPFFL